MSASLSDMRYTHVEGHCVLRYSHDGDNVMTCGADGEVRVFKGIEDEDPVSYLIGDETLALARSEARFFTSASGTNKVQMYSENGANQEGVVARFTADATTIDVSVDGTLLAAGSEDMTLKVVELESFKETLFQGHEAPILSIALDPNNEFVVSTSCDGSLRLWKIETGTQIRSKEDLFPKSGDFSSSKTLAQVKWKGGLFAVALKTSIGIFDKDLTKTKTLENHGLSEEEMFSVLDWSGDGKFVIGGTNKGSLVVWEVDSGKIMREAKSKRKYGIRSVAWNPKNLDEISFLDDHAYWGILSDLDLSTDKTAEKKGDVLNEDELAGLFDDDDDDDENAISIKKIKAATGFISDEEGGETKYVGIKHQEPSSLDAVMNAIKKDNEELKKTVPTSINDLEVDIQEPFQPGSTPTHLSSRFMIWNSVGIIRSYKSETENSIDVEFHDSAVHHTLHMSNSYDYTLADLSEKAIVLANEASEDVNSRITVNYFGSSDLHKEWSLELPDDEEALAITVGGSWVAVGTDRRNLRIFTLGGMQLDIMSLPGPVVSLSGRGDYLMTVIHHGMPLPGNQSMAIAIWDLNNGKHLIPSFVPLPLAPKTYLSWIGFTDEGTPTIVDTAGIIRILNRKFASAGVWTQICDTSVLVKGHSDNYFIIGLSEREDTLRAILCKGSRYPMTVPKPTVSVLSLQLPLCDRSSEKSGIEEQYHKALIVEQTYHEGEEDDLLDDNKKLQSEALVKLFALSCKSDYESRAIEICKLMDSRTIQIAIKYASKIRRIQLATKLSELAYNTLEKEEEEEKERKEELKKVDEMMSQRDMFSSQKSDYEEDIIMETKDPEDDDEQEEEEVVNPILEAKLMKVKTKTKSIRETQSLGENRNPFKKDKKSTTPTGTIRSGIVFDSMSASKQQKQKSSSQFGSRINYEEKIEIKPKMRKTGKLIFAKKPLMENVKETSSSQQAKSEEIEEKALRGFQLWFAENRSEFVNEIGDDEVTIQANGLKRWKELTQEEKEDYKTPRIPCAKPGKRKREDDESSRSKAKLASFAAPE